MAHVQPSQLPGVASERTAGYKRLVKGGTEKFWPGGIVIDGAESRDPTNTSHVDTLQSGTLLGRITASGQFAPSIIGAVTANYTDGGTELTTSAASAAELVRRVGASGTFQLVNAPTAAGTKSTDQVTYSAVDTGTGVITVTDIGADVVAGSIIQPEDGSETILGILGKQDGIKVTDADNANVSVQMPFMLVGGQIVSADIVFWPASATTIQTHIKDALRNVGGGYTFTDEIEG